MGARLRARRVELEPPTLAEQELQILSYAVSHDLSASVRHMSSFSRLLAGELAGELTTRQQLYADHLRLAGENCAAMLEQLSNYSRIQRRELDKTLHDPTPTIQLASLRMASNEAAKAAEISVKPLGAVYADADLLAEAFAVMLDNGLKFHRPGVVPCITVEPTHDEAFWRIRMRDNGIGVEPRHREVAFSMFRRLNSADAYPGVGAGLAICRRIARRHGGDAIFVDCLEGACVDFAVPRGPDYPARRFRKAS